MLQSPRTDQGTRQRHHLWGSLLCLISDNSHQGDFIETTDKDKYFLSFSYLIIFFSYIWDAKQNQWNKRREIGMMHFLRQRITNIMPQPVCFHKQQLLWWQYNSSASPSALQQTCIWAESGVPRSAGLAKSSYISLSCLAAFLCRVQSSSPSLLCASVVLWTVTIGTRGPGKGEEKNLVKSLSKHTQTHVNLLLHSMEMQALETRFSCKSNLKSKSPWC